MERLSWLEAEELFLTLTTLCLMRVDCIIMFSLVRRVVVVMMHILCN